MPENIKKQEDVNWIAEKLEKAEKSGFTTNSQVQILAKSKSTLNSLPSIR
jgi:antitoxin ParD1/3/4